MAWRNEAQQKRFVDEHLKLREKNATQAAINAGYSPKSAYSQASDLLKKPELQKYLQQRKAAIAKELRQEFLYDAQEARKVMYGVMNDALAQDADRLRAARAFLDLAGFGAPDGGTSTTETADNEIDLSDVTSEELHRLARLVPDSGGLVTKEPTTP